MMGIFRIQSVIPAVGPDTVFTIAGYPIANSTLMELFFILLIIVGSIVFLRRYTLKPGKVQNFVEVCYEAVFKLIKSVTGNDSMAHDLFPLVGALFIFIFISNYAGLIPGLNEITYNGAPLFRQPTADFNVTFALALAFVLMIQLASIRDYGVFGYIGKFIKIKELYHGFRQGIAAGMLALIEFAIGFLDIVSEIAKVVSLSLRLFGNMYAGQVLATIILAGFAYLVPAIWMTMSMLSAVVQTLVFALLVTAYYSISVKPPEEAVAEERV